MPWEEMTLCPIGDIQFGAQGSDLDALKRHLDICMRMNPYFIGMGDYVDVASPSGRQKIKNAEFYDSIVNALEEKALEHIDAVHEVLKGTEGRWLGLLEGHHYFESEAGWTSDTVLAERLGTEFLGTCTIVQLRFNRAGSSQTCRIWAHHGQGSGATMASPLNKLERMMSRFPTVDVFLLGHYSRMCGYPVDALVPRFDPPKLKARRRVLAVTGGFMKGYLVGSQRAGRARGSYVEEGMYPPTNLGAPRIPIRPVHTSDEDYLELGVDQR